MTDAIVGGCLFIVEHARAVTDRQLSLTFLWGSHAFVFFLCMQPAERERASEREREIYIVSPTCAALGLQRGEATDRHFAFALDPWESSNVRRPHK